MACGNCPCHDYYCDGFPENLSDYFLKGIYENRLSIKKWSRRDQILVAFFRFYLSLVGTT